MNARSQCGRDSSMKAPDSDSRINFGALNMSETSSVHIIRIVIWIGQESVSETLTGTNCRDRHVSDVLNIVCCLVLIA